MYLLVTGRCGIDLEQGSVGQARLVYQLGTGARYTPQP